MEVCIWRTSDFNAIPKGETEGIPTDIKLLPDTAGEQDQRLHLLHQFGEKERVFVWGRPLRPGGDPVFREVERAKALKAPPLIERLTQRPQIKVVSGTHIWQRGMQALWWFCLAAGKLGRKWHRKGHADCWVEYGRFFVDLARTLMDARDGVCPCRS